MIPLLVEGLVRHARRMNKGLFAMVYRFSARGKPGDYWKRYGHLFLAEDRSTSGDAIPYRMGSGARIRIAASHLKGASVVKALVRLAQGGASLEIVAEHTLRRVPRSSERMLVRAEFYSGVLCPPKGCRCITNSFSLKKTKLAGSCSAALTGRARSYWLNHEIGAISANKELCEAF